MLGIFLAPISAGIKINNENKTMAVKVDASIVRADDPKGTCEIAHNGRGINFSQNHITEAECNKMGDSRRWTPDSGTAKTEDSPGFSLNCGVGGLFGWSDSSLGGCIAQIVYAFWVVSSWIALLGGFVLDWFIYYSTNSSSYTGAFVEQGWGIIRDVANIFFIIALLYVAIRTVLSLHVADNKKLIGMVVFIALFINFSLFTTKVVIDTSNILAKIFYNNITPADDKGNSAIGTKGQKSISAAIVSHYNPQQIMSGTEYKEDGGVTKFIFIVIVLLVVTLYTAYIFFSVALLFVSRVASLWMSMIFAPIAFISYVVPFEIPGFGHKKWWTDLFQFAFLAPIFIFFLYLIVRFLSIGEQLVDTSNSTKIVPKIMGVMIPFVLLVVLLKQAKDIAVKYSGELGAALMKGAQAVGGIALGAATGGAALGLSSLAGAATKNTLADDELRKKAAGGDKVAQGKIDRANRLASKSFDIRQTGIGKGFSKMSGMDISKGIGIDAISAENLKGGVKGRNDRKVEKYEEKMKSYEMTASEAQIQNGKADNYKKGYEKDKKEAKKISDNNQEVNYDKALNIQKNKLAADKEKYDNTYNNALNAYKASGNTGATAENLFKERYEKRNPPIFTSFDEESFRKKYNKEHEKDEFDEEAFKNAYEKGGDLSKFGLNKTVEGKVYTAAEENKERRKAYAYSLKYPKRDENGKGITNEQGQPVGGDFGKALRESMKNRLVPTGELSKTLLTGALTYGMAPLIGGIIDAIKATRPVSKELTARVEKGKSDLEKFSDVIKKATGGNLRAKEEAGETMHKVVNKTESNDSSVKKDH